MRMNRGGNGDGGSGGVRDTSLSTAGNTWSTWPRDQGVVGRDSGQSSLQQVSQGLRVPALFHHWSPRTSTSGVISCKPGCFIEGKSLPLLCSAPHRLHSESLESLILDPEWDSGSFGLKSSSLSLVYLLGRHWLLC